MPTVLSLAPTGFALMAGAALGAIFFHALAVTTRLMLSGHVRRALPLHLLRLGGVAAVFTLIVIHAGAPALLGLLAGFEIARGIAVRRLGKAP